MPTTSTTDNHTHEDDRRARLQSARRRALLMIVGLTVLAAAIIAAAVWLISGYHRSSEIAEARELRDVQAAELSSAHATLSDDLETARDALARSDGDVELGRLHEGLAMQVDNMSSLEILYAEPFRYPSDDDLDALRRQSDLLTLYVENIEDGRPGLVEATTALEDALEATGTT